MGQLGVPTRGETQHAVRAVLSLERAQDSSKPNRCSGISISENGIDVSSLVLQQLHSKLEQLSFGGGPYEPDEMRTGHCLTGAVSNQRKSEC
jgi:hypothetical protein